MGEDIKKAWHERFFTEEELKEFQEIGKKYTPETMAEYQRRWTGLIEEVKRNLDADPAGDLARSLAKRWKGLLEEGFGGHPGLAAKIGQAYTEGAMPRDPRMFGPEVWDFIQKAFAAAKKK